MKEKVNLLCLREHTINKKSNVFISFLPFNFLILGTLLAFEGFGVLYDVFDWETLEFSLKAKITAMEQTIYMYFVFSIECHMEYYCSDVYGHE